MAKHNNVYFSQLPNAQLDAYMDSKYPDTIASDNLKPIHVCIFAVLDRLENMLTNGKNDWFFVENWRLQAATHIKSEKTLIAAVKELEAANWIRTAVLMPDPKYKKTHPVKHYKIIRYETDRC